MKVFAFVLKNYDMKNLKFLFIGCSLFLGFSCNQSSKIEIGYLNWNGENEMAMNTQNSFKQKADKLGVNVDYKDAHNNEVEQFKQAMELIDNGCKVLVIKPVNSILAAKIVRIAHEKGVKVIANDQLIRNCPLDYYVTFDSHKVGEYMAREALVQKPKGTYILIWGDKVDDNADIVKSGVLKVLQPQIDNGNIKILYSNYIEAWSLENAENEMDMIIRLSKSDTKIDAVIASCDDMARGAIHVLKKYNFTNNTFVSGQNADLESLKMILKKEQSITIAKSAKTLGSALAVLAVNLTKSINDKLGLGVKASTFNGLSQVPTIYFDPVVVNSSNLENVILSDGFINLKDISNN